MPGLLHTLSPRAAFMEWTPVRLFDICIGHSLFFVSPFAYSHFNGGTGQSVRYPELWQYWVA